MKITQQAYGKSNVRLSHITRYDDRHEFIELNVSVYLSGNFDPAYISGDNRLVVPTDTMKNTVYALAKQQGIASIELFAITLARYFQEKFDHVDRARVVIAEQLWTRIDSDGELHGHAFTGGGSEQSTCEVIATAEGVDMKSGISGLQVLKTTESGFAGFYKDEFTTLPEVTDRIFATTILAEWPCEVLETNWSEVRDNVRAAILNVFASHYSPSVQKTLYDMAAAVFKDCSEIDEISIEMPNQHHLLADLKKLDMENPNEVFVPTSEPFGMITATIHRHGAKT